MATLSQFTYKKKFKFPTNVVTITANQSNFPHCLHISSASWPTASERNNFFGAWNVNGKRCQFYDKDGNALKFEVEYYSSATQEAVYWIKIPTVFSGDNGTNNYLYVGYGNDPNGADQDDKNNVWDANFKGVWHLGDSSWGSVPEAKDSTVNANNGTNYGSIEADGRIRKGRDFDGNDYVDAGDPPSLDISGPMSISVWMKPRSLVGNNLGIVTKGDLVPNAPPNSFSMHIAQLGALGADSVGLTIFDDPNNARIGYMIPDDSLVIDNWYHIAGTYGGGTTTASVKVYLNAVLQSVASDQAAGTFVSMSTNNVTLKIASGLVNGTITYFNGFIDEVRISIVARSADWVNLEYYSMKKTSWNGDGWYSWNAEELNEVAILYDLLGYASAGLLKLIDLKGSVEALAEKLLDLKVRADAGLFTFSDIKAFMDAIGCSLSDVKSFADAGVYNLSDLKSFTDAGFFNLSDIKSAIEAHLLVLSDVKTFVDATVSEWEKLTNIKMMAAAGLFGISDIKSLIDAGLINFSDVKAFMDASGFNLSDVKVLADAGLINFSEFRSYIAAAVEKLENLKAQVSASLFKLLALKADIGAASFSLKNLKVGAAAGIAYLEDLRAFITVTIRELLGPYVVRYPTPWLGQLNREITEPVRFRIKDNGSGVNLNKLWIKVADVLYKPGEPEISYIGNKNDYQFMVTPSLPFRYNQRVEVAIYAEDLLGNPGLELEPL